jgi:reactive intermediate/imine deaminase
MKNESGYSWDSFKTSQGVLLMKKAIQTLEAPSPIGNYSQAIKVGQVIYFSGQIPLDPFSGELVKGDMAAQIKRIFENLKAIAKAENADLNHIVKLTVYLLDLSHMNLINEAIQHYFTPPYPARTSIAVKALPKGAEVEIEAVLCLG